MAEFKFGPSLQRRTPAQEELMHKRKMALLATSKADPKRADARLRDFSKKDT